MPVPPLEVASGSGGIVTWLIASLRNCHTGKRMMLLLAENSIVSWAGRD